MRSWEREGKYFKDCLSLDVFQFRLKEIPPPGRAWEREETKLEQGKERRQSLE